MIVVITGASAGVGRAVSREFARRGYDVALLARGMHGLEAATREVMDFGRRAIAIPLDVSDAGAVEEAAEQIEREFGEIDIWVNNAMVSVFSPFHLMTAEEFKRVTEVTYLGYVYCTLSALRRMRNRGHGTIVQVGSALAYRSIPLQSAYCGAKHAIEGFTESIRSELLHDAIDVKLTMVHLPAVNTPQFSWVKSRLPGKPRPVAPVFQPEVAAEAIVWAAEHAPRELTLGFRNSVIIFGNKFLPGLGDRYLAQTGYDSQQEKVPVDPDRKDNLWKPLPGDAGAHGDFDRESHDFSLQLQLRKNPLTVTGILLGFAAAFLGLRLRAFARK